MKINRMNTLQIAALSCLTIAGLANGVGPTSESVKLWLNKYESLDNSGKIRAFVAQFLTYNKEYPKQIVYEQSDALALLQYFQKQQFLINPTDQSMAPIITDLANGIMNVIQHLITLKQGEMFIDGYFPFEDNIAIFNACLAIIDNAIALLVEHMNEEIGDATVTALVERSIQLTVQTTNTLSLTQQRSPFKNLAAILEVIITHYKNNANISRSAQIIMRKTSNLSDDERAMLRNKFNIVQLPEFWTFE